MKMIILITVCSIVGFTYSYKAHCIENGEYSFLKCDDDLPCVKIALPKGYVAKRKKCHGVYSFEISKHFFDYPFTKNEYDISNKIKNQLMNDPYNIAVMRADFSKRDSEIKFEGKSNIQKQTCLTKRGREIIWYDYEIDTSVESQGGYNYYSEALLKDIYSVLSKKHSRNNVINCHFSVKSRDRNELVSLQKAINNHIIDKGICENSQSSYFAKFENLSHKEKIQYTMSNLENGIFFFKGDYCSWKFSGNEISNEKEIIYSVDQLNIIAFEQIIPIGKEAIPELKHVPEILILDKAAKTAYQKKAELKWGFFY